MENTYGIAEKKFVKVILPVKFNGTVTYRIPEELRNKVHRGSRIKATFGRGLYSAVVLEVDEYSDYPEEKVIPFLEMDPMPDIKEEEIRFWKTLSEYYLCSIGEVFKAAYPNNTRFGKRVLKKLEEESEKPAEVPEISGLFTESPEPTLSDIQENAYRRIVKSFENNKPVLLNGVTGSGKTEIYIKLALETLEQGRNVLYMLPEIAVSRQLEYRLEQYFKDRLLVYHSKQSAKDKKDIHLKLNNPEGGPYFILGLRSAVFLPFSNLGLIVVDEEHDSSYKQEEPAPRYNGRDAALILSTIYRSKIVLGSATPSYESMYNAICGRYTPVFIKQKYHGTLEPEIRIIDTIRAAKRKEMKFSFSKELLGNIRETVDRGEQAVIFRSRRAYSPLVQCTECGYIPKCPSCNVHLTYHKFDNSLQCHYCGSKYMFNTICPACAKPTLTDKGAGTEKLEEELKSIFPDIRIARYDADTAKSNKESKEIIRGFARKEIDVLIGTQMISKGFDFQNVTLAAIISADSLFAQNDFRADEKALQLIMQLRGRAGRRDKRGLMLIQTAQPENNIFSQLKERMLEKDNVEDFSSSELTLLKERHPFAYPPFTRAIRIIIRNRYLDTAKEVAEKTASQLEVLEKEGKCRLNGPIQPELAMVAGQHIFNIWIWLKRNQETAETKQRIFRIINGMTERSRYDIIIDVDPI